MTNISNILIGFKNRIPFLVPIIYCSILLLLILPSCDDPELQELVFTTPRDSFNYKSGVDTSTMIIKTVLSDSISSSEFSKDLLGTYKNDTFGMTKASIFTEFRLPDTAVIFTDLTVINSITLNLKYSGEYVGDLTEQQSFNIYELNERIYRNDYYYSNVEIDYNPVSIGQWTGTFDPIDTATISISLNQAFVDKISNNKSIFEVDTTFINFFKGIAIIPDENVNSGSIIYFLLENSMSNLTIGFNDSLEVVLSINNNCARISKFEHDYTVSEVINYFNDTGSTNLYLQPLAGLNINLELPHIQNFINDGMIAINKAELIFPIEETGLDTSKLPTQLLLYHLTKDNEKVIPLEYSGGKYNDQRTQYSFTITRHLQVVLKEYEKNPDYDNFNGFLITIKSDNPITTNPVILKHKDSFGNGLVKLVLSYTIL